MLTLRFIVRSSILMLLRHDLHAYSVTSLFMVHKRNVLLLVHFKHSFLVFLKLLLCVSVDCVIPRGIVLQCGLTDCAKLISAGVLT